MDLKELLLFDIDGVIRDVTDSYRLAIRETVNQFCGSKPSIEDIDDLKKEGCWNNDWLASQELISRYIKNNGNLKKLPSLKQVITVFSDFYFGGDPSESSKGWSGFIKNEPLLVNKGLFDELTKKNIGWGFLSGAEPPSARYVLEEKLKLNCPPLVAMGDAPEKPDPKGLFDLSEKILIHSLSSNKIPITYLGDTVADVLTINRAKEARPNQRFRSLAIAPPHLHKPTNSLLRASYEKTLLDAGADQILESTGEVLGLFE